MKKKLIYSLLAVLINASYASAGQTPQIRSQPNPDSPIGSRNSKAPDELSQYDFLIGDWDVDIIWTPVDGKTLEYKAKWHNIWIVDGLVVMQEWRGPYQTGAEFRSYSPQSDSWSGYNVYPTARKGWTKASAKSEGKRMIVQVEGLSDEKGAFLNRETYYDIQPGSFKMRNEKSYDSGQTWVEGDYSMTAVMIRRSEIPIDSKAK